LAEDRLLSKEEIQTLQELSNHSNLFLSEWKDYGLQERRIGTSSESLLKDVSIFRSKIDDVGLLEKVQLYSSLQSQVQLLLRCNAYISTGIPVASLFAFKPAASESIPAT
jgi:hypothetical protein